jgi:hypothetical protein
VRTPCQPGVLLLRLHQNFSIPVFPDAMAPHGDLAFLELLGFARRHWRMTTPSDSVYSSGNRLVSVKRRNDPVDKVFFGTGFRQDSRFVELV